MAMWFAAIDVRFIVLEGDLAAMMRTAMKLHRSEETIQGRTSNEEREEEVIGGS